MGTIEEALVELTELQPWRLQAACLGCEPSLFFVDDDDRDPTLIRQAQRICNGVPLRGEEGWVVPPCPVRLDCLEYAITAEEEGGVWGGETWRARKKIIRQRAKLVAIEPPEHGTYRCYSAPTKCRCDDCRAANTAYKRQIAGRAA